MIPVYLAVIQFPRCRVRVRRLWTGFKVVCCKCNWAEQGLRGSWRPAQASARFYHGSKVLAGPETQRTGLGEEGARGCKACVFVCVQAYVYLSRSLQGSRPWHKSTRVLPFRVGAWQRKSCPSVTFLGGHGEEARHFPPTQPRLQLTLLFHPGAGKVCKTIPPPPSPRAGVLSTAAL